MSSILRQIILKTSDVNKFVKKYNATSSITPEEWARSIENSLFPGVLIFSLEYSSSASTGLSLIQKKDSDSSEPFYRVKDLSIVVQHDNGKALVVFLTNNAFELRFLEPLLIKEARKAILDDKEFNYIIARPSDSLKPEALDALSLLSTNYAQGGSRRGFTNVNNPNLNEPGLALLSFLGFTLPSQSTSGLMKQVLDLGLVAQMICGIDTKIDEKSGSNNYYAIFTDSGINDLSIENQGDSPTIFSQSRINQEQASVQSANFSEESTNILSQSQDNSANIGFEHPAASGGVKPKFPDDFIENKPEAKIGFEHPAASGGVKPKFPDDFIEIQAEAKIGFEHPAASGGVEPKFPDDFIEIQAEAKTGFEHPASSSGGVKPKFPDDFIEIQAEPKTGFEHPASSSGGVKPKFPDDFIEIQAEAKTGFEHPASSSGGVKPKFPDDFIEIQAEAKIGFEHPAASGGVKPKFPDDFIEIQADAKTGFEHPASSSGGVKPKFPDDFIEIQAEAKTGFEHPASSSGGVKPKFPDDFVEIQAEAKTGFEHPASSSGGVKPKFPDDFIEIQAEAKTGFEHPASSSGGVKPKFPDDFVEIQAEAKEEIEQVSSRSLSYSNLEIQQIQSAEIIQVGFDGMGTSSSSVSDTASVNSDSPDLPKPAKLSLNKENAHDLVDASILVDNDLNMSVNSSEKSNLEPTVENSDDLLTLDFDTVDESNVSRIDASNIIASPISLDNSFDNPLGKNAIVGSENELAGSSSSNSLFGKMASRLSDPKIRSGFTDAPSSNNEMANQEHMQSSIKQDRPVYEFNTSDNSEIVNQDQIQSSIKQDSPKYDFNTSDNSKIVNQEQTQSSIKQDSPIYDFNTSDNSEIVNQEQTQSSIKHDSSIYDFNISDNSEIVNQEQTQSSIKQDSPIYDFNTSDNSEIVNQEQTQSSIKHDSSIYDFNISDNSEIVNQDQIQSSIKQDSPKYDFNTSNNSEIVKPEIAEIEIESNVQSVDSIAITVDHAEQMFPEQIDMPALSLGLNQASPTESIDMAKEKVEANDFNATDDLSQKSKPQLPNSSIIESPPVTINETREIDSASVNFMRKSKVSSSTKTTGTKLKAIMQDSNTDTDTEIYNIETASLLNNEKLIDNEFVDNDSKNSEMSMISDKVSLADVLEEIVEESLPPIQSPQQPAVSDTNNFTRGESVKSLSPASIKASSVSSSDSNIKAVQDPKLMMIEVASFVNKLEEQVAKASLKLKVKLDETKLRLGHQAELLYADLTNQASTIENSITDLCINLGTRLEQNYQDANVKLSDYIANQRYDIKHKSQNFDEDLQNLLDDAKSQIGKEFKDMIDEFNQFLKIHNNSFKDFVESNKSTLSGSINLIETELSSIESEYIGKLNQRLNRFQERISQEVESVIKSLERNVMSMSEEVSGSWFRASEQLNLNKADFEHTVNHYIKTSETTVVLIKQQILLEKILPALARFRDTTKDTCEVKLQAFNDLLLSIETTQMDTFNDEINNYLNSFKDNLDLFEKNLEVYTQTQQNGYESIFNDIAQDLEKTTLDLLAQIETAHKNINSNDELCKNLSKVNLAKEDPHLQQEKLSMSMKIELLKKESNKKLNTLVNKKCEDLDMLATQMQAKLSDSRNNSTQEIKEASEEGIQKIRQALQQAFKEIQSARDKCYSD